MWWWSLWNNRKEQIIREEFVTTHLSSQLSQTCPTLVLDMFLLRQAMNVRQSKQEFHFNQLNANIIETDVFLNKLTNIIAADTTPININKCQLLYKLLEEYKHK